MDGPLPTVTRGDAADKASGAALYLADLPMEGMLHARLVRASRPRARLLSVRYPGLPAGYFTVDRRDLPPGGRNRILMIHDDWPVFAEEEVRFVGQTVALIAGPDRGVLASLVEGTVVGYGDMTPAFSLEDSLALAGGPLHGADNAFADHTIVRGDPQRALREAARTVEEEFRTSWQEHAYLEPQGCLAFWEGGKLTVRSSTQCPFYVKKALVHALGLSPADVRVTVPAVGGGFGGKEHYPDVLACAAAVAARKAGRPVRIVLDRGEDMRFTCKRHPSRIRFRTALDGRGRVTGMDVDVLLNAGAYETCSGVVLQRTLFTATGVYDVPNARIRGRAMATDTVPSDAFRGFGAPQAVFAVEMHMDHLARSQGEDPVDFKRHHFLAKGSGTSTGGSIRDEVMLERMLERVLAASGYRQKAASGGQGRGIGVSFFLHGCGFTGNGERDLIKAKVALRRAADGTVRILAAGVDMGQGLSTAFRKIVASVLSLPLDRVSYGPPDTDAASDSGPTVASRSTMVVGYLLQEAARDLRASWRVGEEREVRREYRHPEGLLWDPQALRGDAYPTYGWGVNAVEVEVDPATGEVEVKDVWTAYDVGVPLDRLMLDGSVHGGMAQALGYAYLEKLELRDGVFRQASLADYAVPTSMDFPSARPDYVENPYPYGPFGAKGAGEIVLSGGAPAFAAAVQNAVGIEAHDIPLTPERILELRGTP